VKTAAWLYLFAAGTCQRPRRRTSEYGTLTSREQVEVAPPDEALAGLGVLLPHRKRLDVLVPHGRVLAGHLLEAHAQQVLVDPEDRGHDARDGEVLLDRVVVERERPLDVQAVVVAVVPEIERVLGREPARRALLGLERFERRELAVRNGLEPRLQVVQELTAPSANGAGEHKGQLTSATPLPVLTIFGSVW
jgi:hypothetical protein